MSPMPVKCDEAALCLAILRTTDDAVVSTDRDGIIMSWNAGAEVLFGYPAAEAITKPIGLIVPAAREQEELEIRRRVEIVRSLERMLGRTVDDRTVDLLWAIFGPEVYVKLVLERGMSRADYEACMIDALRLAAHE